MTTPKTYRGYMCSVGYQDYDGCFETAEYIEPEKHDGEPDKNRCEDSLGWYAECSIHPDIGLVGPFETEAEAIKTATDADALTTWMYGDDPMGDHMGRNQ